ncbi:MAG TPA: SET domain-containing protein [Pseudolabrys sp.]|nr:SET domain-containing protein [Pseudolabrys sp.]
MPASNGKPYRVGRSDTGLGLFATEPIKKRTLIIEYRGRRISNKRAAELEWIRSNKYLFELNSRWTIDGKARSNIARYVNHSCKPNAEAELIRGRMMFRAVKNIAAGAEITIDYGEEYVDLFFAKHGCLCEPCRKGKRKKGAAKKRAKKQAK